MLNFVSLVTHVVTVLKEDGSTILVPPGDGLKAIPAAASVVDIYDGIRFEANSSLKLDQASVAIVETIAIEASSEDTILICSAVTAPLVAELVREKINLLICSPGELIKNKEGQPVGCRGLKVW